MDVGIRAARQQVATERTLAAAETLGDRFGLADQANALRSAGHKDADLDALFKAEATADLLESVVQATGPQTDVPDASARLGAMTVDEVTALVEDVQRVDELDALEAAEQQGKQRKGVYESIQARRNALDAQEHPEG